MAGTQTPSSPVATALATIATSPSLPPRVRRILDLLFVQLSRDLTGRINLMLVDVEQQLFHQAERARSDELQSVHFGNFNTLKENRARLLPRFLAALEHEVASIREPRVEAPVPHLTQMEYQTLTLVEDADMDQDIVFREISQRHATRAHTGLYLLGQRFGVLAGTSALEATELPVGPQALCRALRTAAPVLEVNLDTQLLLYKAFDQKVMADYEGSVEVVNQLLSQQGVLPGLVFAPQRAREKTDTLPRRKPYSEPGSEGAQPMTSWYGQGPGAQAPTWHPAQGAARGGGTPGAGNATDHVQTPSAGSVGDGFGSLQQLLEGRREHNRRSDDRPSASIGQGAAAGASAAALSTGDVVANLRALQAMPVSRKPGQPRRTMSDVQDTLLRQVRLERGPDATLVQEDSDTFELLGMLYNEIEREVQSDAPAGDLLVRLQVPVAQAALQDRAFFLRDQHPARDLLNSVAESGARWLGNDDVDPVLMQKLQEAVDRVVADYQGDEQVFESVNNEVLGHFKAMAHKAELTERRHVEAARGKDRLEVAKRRAEETIEVALAEKQPPKFVRALLNQAWADVLTLNLLRNGEESQEWRDSLELTDRIALITSTSAEAAPDPDEVLTGRIEQSLAQVGYHKDESEAIARRLSSAGGEDGTTSRTELTARLKNRQRLGEHAVPQKKPALQPRTVEEQQCHAYLRTLPFGSWFEFVINQQGETRRQRLSWFSPVTDNALFVNQRGQRIGEQSLDSLARLMARDQVRVVTEDKGRLIDRAWQATVKALRSFAGGTAEGATA
jgi:hypothetical protein